MGHKDKRLGKEREAGGGRRSARWAWERHCYPLPHQRTFNLVTARLERLCHMAKMGKHITAKLLDNQEWAMWQHINRFSINYFLQEISTNYFLLTDFKTMFTPSTVTCVQNCCIHAPLRKFRVLFTKHALTECALKLKPGQTLTNQELWFGSMEDITEVPTIWTLMMEEKLIALCFRSKWGKTCCRTH